MKSSVRAFFAIQLPQVVKVKIKTSCAAIQQDISSINLKWVNPENLHITLKFLGEIDLQLVGMYSKLVNDRVGRLKAFELEIMGMGVFPQIKKARVLWVGCNNCDSLLQISKMLEEIGSNLGLPLETKKFSAHITIARIKFPLTPGEANILGNHLTANEHLSFGSWKVNNFSFFKSELRSSGPIYTLLNTFKLA